MKPRHIFSQLKYFAPAALVLLSVGCASTGPEFRPASAAADRALIYLYRPSSMVGAGNHYLAAVNGKVVARMKSGTYFVVDQPPGKVVITRKAASALGWWGPGVIVGALEGFMETDRFNAAGGARYFVHFPSGKRTKEAEALGDMRGSELLPPME